MTITHALDTPQPVLSPTLDSIRSRDEIATVLAKEVRELKTKGLHGQSQEKLNSLCWLFKSGRFTPELHPSLYQRIRDGLIRASSYDTPYVTIAGVTALSGSQDPMAVQAIVDATRDKSIMVRHAAVKALRGVSTPLATDTLTRLIDEHAKDESLVVSAIESLQGTTSATAEAALVQVLSGNFEDPICGTAVSVLQGNMSESTVAAVVRLLESDSPEVRLYAAESLHRCQHSCALEPLLHLLEDTEPDIRRAALLGLQGIQIPRIQQALRAALADENGFVRYSALKALSGSRDQRSIDGLLACVLEKDLSIASLASRSLAASRHPAAIAGLLSYLEHEQDSIRLAATSSLQEAVIPEAFNAALLNRCTDSCRAVRDEAVKVLHKNIQHRNISPELLPTIIDGLHKPEVQSRIASAKILKGCKDPAAIKALADCLHAKDYMLRYHAASALKGCRDEWVLEKLTDLLKDRFNNVRSAATRALQGTDFPKAIETFAQWLAEEDAGVRRLAAIGLRSTSDPQIQLKLCHALNDSSGDVRQASVLALSNCSEPEVFPALIAKFSDDSLREQAIRSLSAPSHPEAIEQLLRKCHKRGGSIEQGCAAKALIGCRNLDAIECLISMLESDDEFFVYLGARALEGTIASS